MDIQGYIIEKLSRMTLPEFMKKRLFEPLGMKDTDFYVPKEKRNRFSTLYRTNETGELTASEGIPGFSYEEEPSVPSGGGGLVSTVADYFRFAQMLLNGGVLEGVRVLGPQTVKLMMENHLTDRLMTTAEDQAAVDDCPRPGMGYGYDGGVVTDPGKADVPLAKGLTCGRERADTWFWVDPLNDIVFVGMTQNLSAHTGLGQGSTDLRERARAVVYQALIRPDL